MRLQDDEFLSVPAVHFNPIAMIWVSVDWVDIPTQPSIPGEFAEALLAEPSNGWPTITLPVEPPR
ncbi:MAG: hypothetical protein ACHQFZ_10755, partial [Acidimicrobiales bacterium]